jgi:hypothetical protein
MAFIDVTTGSAVGTKYMIPFINQRLMKEHLWVLECVQGA